MANLCFQTHFLCCLVFFCSGGYTSKHRAYEAGLSECASACIHVVGAAGGHPAAVCAPRARAAQPVCGRADARERSPARSRAACRPTRSWRSCASTRTRTSRSACQWCPRGARPHGSAVSGEWGLRWAASPRAQVSNSAWAARRALAHRSGCCRRTRGACATRVRAIQVP